MNYLILVFNMPFCMLILLEYVVFLMKYRSILNSVPLTWAREGVAAVWSGAALASRAGSHAERPGGGEAKG